VTAAAASGAAASRGEGLRRAYRDRRYAVLFYTLFLTLGAIPLLTAFGFSADVLQVFLALSLLLAVLDVPDQRWRTVLMLLAAVAFGVRAAPIATAGAGMATGALVVVSGIALLAVVSTIRFALRARAVGSEHVYAALSAYLLAGLFFGLNIALMFTAITMTSIAHAEFITALSPLFLVPAGAIFFALLIAGLAVVVWVFAGLLSATHREPS